MAYQIKGNKFFEMPNMNYGRIGHTLIEDGEYLYSISGRSADDDDGIIASVEKFNISELRKLIRDGKEEEGLKTGIGGSSNRWIEVEPLNRGRVNGVGLIFKRDIYVMGGLGKRGKIEKSVEKYNSVENRWTLLNFKMPFAIHSTTITGMGKNEILFIGGRNENGLVPSIYQMDLGKKVYQSKGAFSFRVNCKVLHLKEDVYIFGGDKEKSCEKLNPIQFISYAASESYTTFINSDLMNYPAGHPTLKLEGGGEEEIKVPKNWILDAKITDFYLKTFSKFLLFGTPNHPFALQLSIKEENAKFIGAGLGFQFYYYSCCFRLNENYAVMAGGIIPPRKKATKKVQLIYLKNMAVLHLAKLSFGRCKAKIIGNQTNNKLYVIGGITFKQEKEEYLNDVECYDFATNQWEKIANLNIPRYNLDCCIYKGDLYAFGGCDGNNYLTSIEKFDSDSKKWILFDDFTLHKGLSNFSLCWQSEDELLLFGGNSMENFSSEIVCLDMKAKSLKIIGELKESRAGLKVIKIDDGYLIIGGSRSDLGVEMIKKESGSEGDEGLEGWRAIEEAMSKFYRDKTLNGICWC